MTRPPHDHHRTCQHKQYYLTCAEFDLLWQHAAGRCWRCGVHETETKANKLAIDHKGGVGQVRGLLCYRCNTILEWRDRRGRYDPDSLRYLGMMVEVLPDVSTRANGTMAAHMARQSAWATRKKAVAEGPSGSAVVKVALEEHFGVSRNQRLIQHAQADVDQHQISQEDK